MSEQPAAPVRHLPPQPTPYPADSDKPTVHEAMATAMREVGPVGKTGINSEQGYRFRSIDRFMDALSPAMAGAGVHVVPQVLTRLVEERTTQRGSRLRCVDLEVAFTFYGPAGDSVVAVAWGEGTDTLDKATNKAMTGAFKYAIVQVFMVPTADLQDSDQHGGEPAATRGEQAAQEQARADASPEVVEQLRNEILAVAAQPKAERGKALQQLWKRAQAEGALGSVVALPTSWQAMAQTDSMALHSLITGVRDTDELPDPAEGLGATTTNPDTGRPPRCEATRDSDGGRCEKDLGHTGRHSYLAPTGATSEPQGDPQAQPDTDAAQEPAQGATDAPE